jgi:hypothetical protein
VYQRQGADASGRDSDIRWHDSNIVSGSRQREECVRGGTFQNDAWLDVRDIARCVEPSARRVIAPQ